MRAITVLGLMLVLSVPAFAGITDSYQVPTPGLPSQGTVSVSYTARDQKIGNPDQASVSLTPVTGVQVNVAQGLKPGTTTLSSEISANLTKNVKVAGGVLGWNTRGGTLQPFAEVGFNVGDLSVTLGGQREPNKTDVFEGLNLPVTSKVSLIADHKTGASNFTAAGLGIQLTPNLSVNPGVFWSNQAGNKTYGYGQVTYTVSL